MAAVAGLAYTFVTPPFRVPDEVGHLWRAVSLAYGDVLPRTDARGPYSAIPNGIRMLPFAMGADQKTLTWGHFKNSRNLKLADDDRRIAHLPAPYTPVAHAPQIVAALIGRVFKLLPIDIFYLGRLLNLGAFISIVWMAIRIAPFGKWIFCAVALLPMTMYLAASWSPDAMTIALALLVTAMAMRLPERPVVLAVTCAALALCKPAYVLLAFVAIIRSKRRAAFLVLAATLIAAALSFGNAAHGGTGRVDARVDSAAQRQCITSHPAHFATFLVGHVSANAFLYTEQMIGRLGMLDIKLPPIVIWSEIVLLLMTALSSGGMSARTRVIALLVVFVTAAAILVGMFVGYSRSCDSLEGVQGRYFLPLLPLALAACAIRVRGIDRLMPILVPAIAGGANITGVVCVLLRYYY